MMRFLAAALTSALVLTAPAASAHDHGPALYDHNGSVMRLAWGNGDSLQIIYDSPKSGLGVRSGTILFSGSMTANGKIYGTARVFKSGCNPGEYAVEGSMNDGSSDISLSGYAPIWSGCSIVGYQVNQHSYLYFEALYD